MLDRLRVRAHHRDLHGHEHIGKQRFIALVLIVTGLVRVTAWATLIALYLIGVPFTHSLFQSVAFVALISLYANAATDFGQVCASLAQLTAGDAHADSEHTRAALQLDMAQIDADLKHLADMQPCTEARQLARRIAERLKGPGPA